MVETCWSELGDGYWAQSQRASEMGRDLTEEKRREGKKMRESLREKGVR